MSNRTNTCQLFLWEYRQLCSHDGFVVSLFCYVAYYYLDGGVFYHKESRENRDELLFMQTDNLGSTRRIYGKTGATVFEATYDAWGQRTVVKDSIDFRRGYTGHEHLAEFGLINMNGRLYLPLWLFGEYELQIVRGTLCFYTYIDV